MSLDTLRAGLATAPARPRRGRLLIAVVTVAMAGAGAAAVWARTTTPGVVRTAQTAGPRHAPAAPSTTSTTSAPARVWPTTTTTAAVARSAPLLVEHDGASFAVGAAGDRTVVGRFGCGDPLLAVLRADGDAFLFATWASGGADVVGAPIGHVDNARDVHVEDADGDGCDELVVVRADGTSERLTA